MGHSTAGAGVETKQMAISADEYSQVDNKAVDNKAQLHIISPLFACSFAESFRFICY